MISIKTKIMCDITETRSDIHYYIANDFHVGTVVVWKGSFSELFLRSVDPFFQVPGHGKCVHGE
jgi:hypothetical protein